MENKKTVEFSSNLCNTSTILFYSQPSCFFFFFFEKNYSLKNHFLNIFDIHLFWHKKHGKETLFAALFSLFLGGIPASFVRKREENLSAKCVNFSITSEEET